MAKKTPASSQVTIYHNPRCAKSRETLALLRQHGVEPQIIEYLKAPPDKATLKRLLGQLNVPAAALVRKKEHRALGLPQTGDADKLIAQIAAHPEIMERPVVVAGGKARLGRPPEAVLEIL